MTNQTSIRPWLRRFAETMEQQLRENDWKGDFQEMDFGDLLHCIDEELDELKAAVTVGASAADVVKEAADAANFLAALARLAWGSDPPEEETWEDEMKRRAKDPRNIFQRFQDRQLRTEAEATVAMAQAEDGAGIGSNPEPSAQADSAEAEVANGSNAGKYSHLYDALERIAAASAPDENGWHEPSALDHIHRIATAALEGRRDHDSA